MSKIRQSINSFNNNDKNSISSNMLAQPTSTSVKQKDVATQNQMTKKRSALGNISNGTGGSTNNSLVSCNNGSGSSINSSISLSVKEVSKKSRFGSQDSNAASIVPTNCMNAVQPVLKKSDSSLANKKSSFLSKETVTSKENFSSLLPSTFLNKKKTVERKSLLQLAECKQKDATHQKNQCLTAPTSMKLEKSDLNEIKQEAIQKLEQLKTENGLAKSSESENDMQELDGEEQNIELLKEEEEPVENWDDIDANDNDEFNANDYVNYIFKYYKEREDKFTIKDYIREQPHINKQMRLLLVDWMVEVQQQLEFNHEVLYLSVKLLDLYLNGRKVEKEKLQLLGGAAMFIACKFEERMPPIIDDFIYVSDNAYNRKELIKMEIDILKSVRFDIGIPLSYTFLRRYAKCVKADMRFLTLARYILELSLQEYCFAFLKDSLKACAALYLALKMTVAHENNHQASLERNNQSNSIQLTVSSANLAATEWNATLIHYTGCNVSEFIDFLPAMNNLISAAPNSKYKTIYRKYSHHVFYEVAKVGSLAQNEIDSLVESSKNFNLPVRN